MATIDTKRLRQKLLDLAVRGKLVQQDPNDEPASVLLERIREERHELIKEGKIKAPKGGESVIYRTSDGSHYEKRIDAKGHESEPVCIDEEIPFEIPETWEWARLNSLGEIVGGGTPKTSDPSLWGDERAGIPWITPADMKNIDDGKISHGNRYISKKGLDKSSAQLMPSESVLMSSRAPVGYLALSTSPLATNQGFKSIVPQNKEMAPWILCILSARIDDIKRRASGTTFKEISGSEFGITLLPIPPYDEQSRIVTALDKYLGLVDTIENNSVELEKLYDTLRAKVLDLSIRGKLVPQNPNDEPAAALLERIREERHELIKEGKIKAPKGGESVIYRTSDGGYYEKRIDTKGHENESVRIDDEIPFEIPESWEWCRLGSYLEIERGGSPRPIKAFLTTSESGINWIKISDAEKGGKYISTTKEKIKPEGLRKSRYVVEGDFLLTNSMSFGRPYILKTNGCIHDGWLVIREPEKLFIKDFLYYLLSSRMMFLQFEQKAAGSEVSNLNIDRVKDGLVVIPPLEEQSRIVAKIDELCHYLPINNSVNSFTLLCTGLTQVNTGSFNTFMTH